MPNNLISVLFLIAVSACGNERARNEQSGATGLHECETEARKVVEQLGTRMRMVSLLAPDSARSRAMRDAYAELVTPDLLSKWEKAPDAAPGRQVSNPWPIGIAVSSVASDSVCRVEGNVVYVTSADTIKEVQRRPVSIQVQKAEGWRVSAFNW